MTSNSPTLTAILKIRPARAQQYGDAKKGFRCIAQLWEAYLSNRPGGAAAPITAIDVPVMISLMKTARIATGAAHHDNFTDGANYLILAGDLEAENMEEWHGADSSLKGTAKSFPFKSESSAIATTTGKDGQHG